VLPRNCFSCDIYLYVFAFDGEGGYSIEIGS
jgi:hypothetical protein